VKYHKQQLHVIKLFVPFSFMPFIIADLEEIKIEIKIKIKH